MALIIPSDTGVNPTFTGLLTTPTLRLNGTAVIVNSSAPTVRSDGSALVAGDFWLNPSTGRIGFWRSPYWLSTDQYFVADIVRTMTYSGGANNAQVLIPHLNFSSVFLEECSLGLMSPMTGCDSNNYWEVYARYDTDGIVDIPGGKITVNTNLSDNTIVFATLNLAILLSGNTRLLYAPRYYKVGTPGNLAAIWAVKLRVILN